MAKVLGRATVKINGRILDCNKGSTMDPGGVARTSKTTSQGRVHYMEETRPSRVECSIPHTADVSLSELAAIEDATINFETDVGAGYVVPHAFLTAPPTTGDRDGDIALVFEGDPAEELS